MPDDPRKALLFLVGFWLALTALTPPAPGEPLARSRGQSSAAPAEVLLQLEAQLAAAVNGYRAEHHLVALERKPELDAVARAHSRDMAARHYLSHESPEGSNWVDRLTAARIRGFSLAGENVGLTSRGDPNREILSGWIHSTVHRENLLARPYNATGIGVARAPDGTLYYTQLYLTFPR